ncbi:hypothetical protein MTBLM1_20200 [Rhodospirillaceae bacterium LM-1]|nr:hypothetical protein MTBLM1_20200 [Rhodospirillaceae bacterium LM-1]
MVKAIASMVVTRPPACYSFIMSHVIGFSWILLAAAFLSGCAASIAEPASLESADMKALIAQTKAAYEADDPAVTKLLDDLYDKVTGLPKGAKEKPESMDGVEFERRRCIYWKIVDGFDTPPEVIEASRHGKRLAGLALIEFGPIDSPELRIMIDCGKDIGRQVSLSRLLEDGIAWARKLKSATPNEARKMAREYEDLLQQQPHNRTFRLLRDTALWEAKERENSPDK